jgi:hypothetical protein
MLMNICINKDAAFLQNSDLPCMYYRAQRHKKRPHQDKRIDKKYPRDKIRVLKERTALSWRIPHYDRQTKQNEGSI